MPVVAPPAHLRRIAWIEPSRLPYDYDDQNVYSGILFPRAGPKMAGLLQSLGYEVEVISGELSRLDPDEIAADFDVACISVLSNTAPYGMILGRWLSARGMTVVMGGYQFAHTQTTPLAMRPTEQALDFVPYVVRGEGYAALPMLLDALADRGSLDDVPGLSYRDESGRIKHNAAGALLSKEVLNALPLQDWSVVRDGHKMELFGLHGMYGCPRECSWCAVWPRDGRQDRTISPQHLVDELERSLSQGKFRHVFMSADNFPALHRWAQEVCEEITRRGLEVGWTCQAEVGATRHKELLDAMLAAGCEGWCLGLESINPDSLKDSRKRQDRELMEEAIRTLHARGIHLHGMFIVGLPHDTPETVQATADWARKVGLETVQFLCLADLPGSYDYEHQELGNKAFRPFDGAYEPLNWLFVTGHYARIGNEDMDVAAVQEAMARAMLSFYKWWRAIPALLGANMARFRTSRARGRSVWRSFKDARLHNMFAGLFRLRGWILIHRWLKVDFNQAYVSLLSATPEEAPALRARLLAHLPPEWLRTLEEVDAERRARLLSQEVIGLEVAERADEVGDAAADEVAQDEAQEERQEALVAFQSAVADDRDLAGPGDHQRQPHRAHRPRRADAVAHRVKRKPDEADAHEK
jgi:pyruvate-formate lyase-activating enzyme